MKWHIGRPSEYGTFSGSQIYDENNNGICQMYRLPLNVTLEEIEAESDVYGDALANAYLIASAPEMLTALERAEQTIRNLGNGFLTGDGHLIAMNESENLQAIIAKARGEA